MSLISFLASCGFQLRGDLYAELDKVHVTSAPSAMKSEKILNEILAVFEKGKDETSTDPLIINLVSEKSSRRSVLTTVSMSAAHGLDDFFSQCDICLGTCLYDVTMCDWSRM